jgi:hypothetical protein
MPSKVRWRAYRAVRYAIAAGGLVPLAEAVCVECGAPAAYYHHAEGYAPPHETDVEPVCADCHGKRAHHPVEDGYRKRLTVELLPGEEVIVRQLRSAAIARGETLRDVVMQALRAMAAEEQRKMGG